MNYLHGLPDYRGCDVIDYQVARSRMVKEQLISRGITDERVLQAMSIIPRHLFIDQAFLPRAYGDSPLPIGCDQTISQPYIVATMTQEIGIKGDDKILEIGTGSGYQTAILSFLGARVYTIERNEELSKQAETVIRNLNIKNVRFKIGDGSIGWEKHAPYDGIIVTAGAPDIPDELMEQLAVGGTIVIPVGKRDTQRLIRVTKGENIIEKHEMLACSFVPLLGKQGW